MTNPARALADFNGDLEFDLAVAADDARVILLFGNGDGSFYVGGGFDVTDDALCITTEELNGDQHIDIVVGCDDGYVYSYLGTGGGAFALADSWLLPDSCYALGLSSFDGRYGLDRGLPGPRRDTAGQR